MPTATDSLTTCAHCGHVQPATWGHGFVTDPVTGERVPVCVVARDGQPSCYQQVVLNNVALGGRCSS